MSESTAKGKLDQQEGDPGVGYCFHWTASADL